MDLASRVVRRFIAPGAPSASWVVSRHKEAVLLSDKWFKAKKAELKGLLKEPVRRDDPSYWGPGLQTVRSFFDRFQKDFEDIVSFDQATESIRTRVETAKTYLEALQEKLYKAGTLRDGVDFDDPASYLKWYAVVRIHEKMHESAKTVGDLFKWSWAIDEDMVNRLVAKTLKAASPEERESLTHDSYNANTKWAFLSRVGFEKSALKALSRIKLDAFDPTKWVDRVYEALQYNYSEEAVSKQGGFRQFDLKGMKVIVEDKTVLTSDIKKYVEFLIQAHAKLRAKGFEKAWYGNVFIQCQDCGGVNPNTGGGVGGDYADRPDTVRVYSRPSDFIVELVVHELGHRYWFKQLTSEQRGRFSDLVKTHTVRRPSEAPKVEMYDKGDFKYERRGIRDRLETVEVILKQVRGVNRRDLADVKRAHDALRNEADEIEKVIFEKFYQALKTEFNLDSELAPLADAFVDLKSKLADHLLEVYGFDPDDPSTTPEAITGRFEAWIQEVQVLFEKLVASALVYMDVAVQKHNELTKQKLRGDPLTKEWMKSLDVNPNPVEPVSTYGASNIDEAFAEVFTHYVLEEDITRDQMESFRSVLARQKHYKYDDRRLRQLNSPSGREEGMRLDGGYEVWHVEIVPLRDVHVPKVWKPERFEKAKALMEKGVPLDPIRATKVGGKWEINDGIHRTNASIALGYTHVPVMVPTWVATPEAKVEEPPEKPKLPLGTWVKLHEPIDGKQIGWAREYLRAGDFRGVRRHWYNIALVEPGDTWPEAVDLMDTKFEPIRPPSWGPAVKAVVEGP